MTLHVLLPNKKREKIWNAAFFVRVFTTTKKINWMKIVFFFFFLFCCCGCSFHFIELFVLGFLFYLAIKRRPPHSTSLPTVHVNTGGNELCNLSFETAKIYKVHRYYNRFVGRVYSQPGTTRMSWNKILCSLEKKFEQAPKR